MEQPIQFKRGPNNHRPPKDRLVVVKGPDHDELCDLVFDAMLDIHRGYERLQAVSARLNLVRRQWVTADRQSAA